MLACWHALCLRAVNRLGRLLVGPAQCVASVASALRSMRDHVDQSPRGRTLPVHICPRLLHPLRAERFAPLVSLAFASPPPLCGRAGGDPCPLTPAAAAVCRSQRKTAAATSTSIARMITRRRMPIIPRAVVTTNIRRAMMDSKNTTITISTIKSLPTTSPRAMPTTTSYKHICQQGEHP